MRILVVTVAVPPHAFGGSDLYADDLAVALASRHDVHVFTRGPLAPGPLVAETTRGAVSYTTFTTRPPADVDATARLRDAFVDTVERFRPDVVHVHHLRRLSFDLPRLASERGSAVVYTLHDFWLMCERTFLTNASWQPCDGPGYVKCWDCLSRVPAFFPRHDPFSRATGRNARALLGASPMRHAARRHVIRAMLASVDLLVSPSRHLRERYVREFGLQADAIALCPYGIATRSNATRSARTSRGRLRVGYVGAVHFHKGVHVLLEALRRPLDADLSVFGASSEEFDAAFGAELRARAAVRGPIAADRRAAIYDDIDVLVVPSVHHENAPFVIQEAFAAGVPVIAADLAGMAEAVRDGVDGLLFRPGDAGALRAAVERVIKDRALLDRLAANVPAVKSLEDDAAEMATLYERARARKAVRRT